MDPMQVCLDNIDKEFKSYNRERYVVTHAHVIREL